jgi:hypothetical protein
MSRADNREEEKTVLQKYSANFSLSLEILGLLCEIDKKVEPIAQARREKADFQVYRTMQTIEMVRKSVVDSASLLYRDFPINEIGNNKIRRAIKSSTLSCNMFFFNNFVDFIKNSISPVR